MPANVGTFELGVLAILKPFGVPTELCLAFGLLYHMAQVLPVVGLAMLDGRFISRAHAQRHRDASDVSTSLHTMATDSDATTSTPSISATQAGQPPHAHNRPGATEPTKPPK